MLAPRIREITPNEDESPLDFVRRGAVEFNSEAMALVYLADVLREIWLTPKWEPQETP